MLHILFNSAFYMAARGHEEVESTLELIRSIQWQNFKQNIYELTYCTSANRRLRRAVDLPSPTCAQRTGRAVPTSSKMRNREGRRNRGKYGNTKCADEPPGADVSDPVCYVNESSTAALCGGSSRHTKLVLGSGQVTR